MPKVGDKHPSFGNRLGNVRGYEKAAAGGV